MALAILVVGAVVVLGHGRAGSFHFLKSETNLRLRTSSTPLKYEIESAGNVDLAIFEQTFAENGTAPKVSRERCTKSPAELNTSAGSYNQTPVGLAWLREHIDARPLEGTLQS